MFRTKTAPLHYRAFHGVPDNAGHYGVPDNAGHYGVPDNAGHQLKRLVPGTFRRPGCRGESSPNFLGQV